MKQKEPINVTEQLIMAGVVSEKDIFRSMMKKIGAKGGNANSDAQQKARHLNIRKAIAGRAKKYAK